MADCVVQDVGLVGTAGEMKRDRGHLYSACRLHTLRRYLQDAEEFKAVCVFIHRPVIDQGLQNYIDQDKR